MPTGICPLLVIASLTPPAIAKLIPSGLSVFVVKCANGATLLGKAVSGSDLSLKSISAGKIVSYKSAFIQKSMRIKVHDGVSSTGGKIRYFLHHLRLGTENAMRRIIPGNSVPPPTKEAMMGFFGIAGASAAAAAADNVRSTLQITEQQEEEKRYVECSFFSRSSSSGSVAPRRTVKLSTLKDRRKMYESFFCLIPEESAQVENMQI